MTRRKRFLAAWLPNWPLQHRYRVRPAPEGVDLAFLLHREGTRGGLEVAAACSRAVAAGVRPGMSLAEARAAASQWNLMVEPHDPALDLARLRRLAHWCERFSPLVGLEEAAEPETLILDVTGCGPAFGGEHRLVRLALRSMVALWLHPRFALADAPAAAWAIARYGTLKTPPAAAEQEGGRPRVCDQPSGWLVVESGRTESVVRSLPLAALRLAPDARALLAALGLESIGQLEDLPRETLAPRFGDDVTIRLEQTLGLRVEVVRPERTAPIVSVEWPFETPVADGNLLARVRGELVERLTAALPGGQGFLRIECRLQLEVGGAALAVVELARPNRDSRRVEELLQLSWERLRLPARVTDLRLTATLTDLVRSRQGDFFESADDAGALADLLERLSNRLGRGQVARPRLHPDPQPECAVYYEPLIGEKRLPASLPAPEWIPPNPRPMRLRPQPVEVVVEGPVEGPPRGFRLKECWCRVAEWAGPERIETGWWRGPSVRRDYFRVKTEEGRRWWIFRRIEDDRWFLHGEFD